GSLPKIETQFVEIAPHRGIESRSARNQDTHLSPDDFVDCRKENRAQIQPSQVAQDAIDMEQRAEKHRADPSAFGNLAEYALVNEIEVLRDTAEKRGAPLAQGPQHFRGADLFEVDDARAH